MIVTISEVSQEFASNGSEYRKVKGTTESGAETTKQVFNNLEDKWVLLIEGNQVEFKMAKKGQFWNVIDILPVEGAPGPEEEPEPAPALSPKKGTQIPKTGTPPKPVSPTAETPPKSEKVKVSKEILLKDIISMHTMCLSYAKDMAVQGLIAIDGVTPLADQYLDWLMKKLSKWL